MIAEPVGVDRVELERVAAESHARRREDQPQNDQQQHVYQGTEGKLGGQAQVPGVGGTWKDLTDTVNVMAANLTEQVRGIVKVVTAVAEGDLKQNLFVQSKGEVAALADTINDMTKTLAIFADQVTSVAREVGVEGRLGGQANVPGASGTWKDLTGNVNLLAANLTNQVRAIAEVATAVTKGDLTRSIQVEARGEVADLKDNINTMIDNLRLTTDRNTEQDWLKTNLARFTGMLQGQRDLATVGRLLLSELAPLVNAHQGLIYQMAEDGGVYLKMLASYANAVDDPYPVEIALGEGFIGQCALDQRRIMLTNVPEDTIAVGPVFFNALPRSVAVFPVIFEGKHQGGAGAGVAERIRPVASGISRAADRQHRHRAQQHRGHDADRGAAQAVAEAGRANCSLSKPSCSRPTTSSGRRRSSSPSRTPRSSARTARSSRRGARWRKRRPSWR